MTRLILMVVLAGVTWLYFPETRESLLDVTEPIVVPVVRWSTEEEMEQVARNVVEHERLTGDMPAGDAWTAWLGSRYLGEEMTIDPWGSVYQLEVSRDSVWIVSPGPDRTRQTTDDFRVAAPRG